ncbi:MAG TPA: hypothetical protein PLV45_01155 [bacterium]|nr:hypothetical protein [bacterium]
MKHLLIVASLFLIVAGAQASVYFTITPGGGYSEPLNDGDVIEVDQTTQPAQFGEEVVDSYWTLYYNNIDLGDVYTTLGAFVLDTAGNLVGSDALNVSSLTAANRVYLHIWSRLGPSQFHTHSTNYLEVTPTTPMVPATGFWGMLILLLAVPAYLLWRR